MFPIRVRLAAPSYSDELRACLAAPSRSPAADAAWTRAEAVRLELVPLVETVAGADSAAPAAGSAELAQEPCRSVQAVAGSVEAHSGDCLGPVGEQFLTSPKRSVLDSAGYLLRAQEKRSGAARRSAEAYSAGRCRWMAALPASRPEPTTEDYWVLRCCWV